MRSTLCCIVAALALLCSAHTLRAQVTQVYSFEDLIPNPDGFFGLGATVSQDTIGATAGANSLKYDVGVGGFVGARTETLIPAELNDPPGVVRILFDMTVPEAYTGTFADLGITIFGHALNAPGGAQFGHQVQFADTVSIAALGAGTHTDLAIDLDMSVGPYRPGESFNAIFGPNPNDLTTASAFQFFINKNVTTPVTVYLDNVRLVSEIPEPTVGALLTLTAAFGVIRRRR